MKSSKARKDILYISISSFFLVVAWIVFNIYHTAVTSTISPDLQIQIIPIDPSFDTSTIQNLKLRKRISPAYETINTSTPEASITPSENALTTPTPTISSAVRDSSSSGSVKPTTAIERVGR